MSEFAKSLSIKNRKASFEYTFIDKYTAGVALTGTEVKSVRQSKVNLQHAFCSFHHGELFIKEMHISPYNLASHYNHETTRERKLLLNKNELKKLFGKSKEKGLTIIPTRLFISEGGHIKIDIALAKGKKLFDKREDIKQKDIKRELSRVKF